MFNHDGYFAGIAEFTASAAKACDISELYSRKKPQYASFNNYFIQRVIFAIIAGLFNQTRLPRRGGNKETK
jgi:hypothetical protein